MTLVKMFRAKDGRTVDVHPDMVADYRRGDYVEVAQEAVADIPTKTDIATMKKQDCIEWLEAHGAEVDPKEKIGGLRDKLRSIMFIGDE